MALRVRLTAQIRRRPSEIRIPGNKKPPGGGSLIKSTSLTGDAARRRGQLTSHP
jgi:hypothetical protein